MNMLFVGLSDSTTGIECFSLYMTFSHSKIIGPQRSSHVLRDIFLVGREKERAQLRACDVVSTAGRAKRQIARLRAAEVKLLTTHHGSKKKLRKLPLQPCKLAKAEVSREHHFSRGEGLTRKHYAQRTAG